MGDKLATSVDTDGKYYMPAEELEYLEGSECSDPHACGPLETTWYGVNLKVAESKVGTSS
ncbi:uncharacterized protein N7469_003160 [Penicillium citrinum]|uniref:Uncharacterized protein n=2 Tax=Penicillium TaxID=5073 RepID=A0A9W9TW12_PENCI|nr:uncharacterized protein N7469_003160 [Penicillium citrinum]KAJ5241569.1 hypothetical protein N7469_003160 [Penicillium citrinum]KAJ5586579.1 hypothetical protein N7450_006366 [Penicillium hetheringtonii]